MVVFKGARRASLTFFLLASLLASIGGVSSLNIPTYNIHTDCNRTVDMKRENIHLGTVAFDMAWNGALSQRSKTCTIVIVPWFSKPNIQYYFSTLNIPECSNSRIRIERSSDGRVYKYPTGLIGEQCGIAVSNDLVYEVLTVMDSYLRVTFTWTRNTYEGTKFTLVFNSYSTGTCDSSDFKCDNNHCIIKNITCENYNTCGDHSDCDKEELSEEVQRALVIIIGVIAGLSVLICGGIACLMVCKWFCAEGECCESLCECCGSCISCFAYAGRACWSSTCKLAGRCRTSCREKYDNYRERRRRRREAEREAETNRSQTTEPTEQTTVTFSSISHTAEYDDNQDQDGVASGFDTSDPPPPYPDKLCNKNESVPSAPPREDDEELAPPPNYEDVMGRPSAYMTR